MNLDYNGIPEQEFKRDLSDKLNPLATNAVELLAPVGEDEATQVFNELAKTLIKGDKLKQALANLNPAAFIPVEEFAMVKSSLDRLKEDNTIITYGLFKTCVDFLNSREDAVDENFLIDLNIIDVQEASKNVVKVHKNIKDTKDDWLTDFLINLSVLAGATLASYLNDLAFSRSGKVPTPDGSNAGTQTQQQHAQGIGVGIALMIEIGVTLVAMAVLLEPPPDTSDTTVADTYKTLSESPAKRKEILESAGYDYDALVHNKKYDDCQAVKHYALEYISKLSSDVQYDHWIAYVNVADNQGFVSSAFAMAPMYSKKWNVYQRTGNTSVLTTQNSSEEEEGLLAELEQKVASGLTGGLRDYFSSLLQVSNDHYNHTLQVYTMQIDERLMCCILWFVGPLETGFLKKLSEILRILGLRVSIDWKSLISRLGEGLARAIANMILSYINMFMDKIVNEVFNKLFEILDVDWEIAIKKCIGIDILFDLLNQALVFLYQEIAKLTASLMAMISGLGGKATASVEVAAERRWLVTLAALIDSVVDKFEAAAQTCVQDEDLTPEAANDLAAEAAVQFVIDSAVNLKYPVIELSNELRQKYFTDAPEFKTTTLNLPVPGLDETGKTQALTTQEVMTECGEFGRAQEGIAIGKKIADILNS